MKIKILSLIALGTFLASSMSFAESFKIPLDNFDSYQLADQLQIIDPKYRSEEVIDGDSPMFYILKKINFLDDSHAFYINCSQKFYSGSVYPTVNNCEIGFNYELSSAESINVYDGSMENLVIAEIKDQFFAFSLYRALQPVEIQKVTFFSKEKVLITNPASGNKTSVRRLEIVCNRDVSYQNIDCKVYAVK